MPDHQRIFVVSTSADAAALSHLRADLGRHPAVLAAPTPEAARLVRALEVGARAETLLAPVSYPPADRGHRLDGLVRRHALLDRFRDVVVVTDPATATLLLRALAPDQLPTGGAVTVVGLPRGDRPIVVRRAVAGGVALGVVAALAGSPTSTLALPGAAAVMGSVLQLVLPLRHLGRELLLASAISIVVVLAVVAGSARFPGGW